MIAITGKMRSGKDAVAGYLVENYGFTRYAFGDELKRYAHELFGPSPAKPRELYQWFGQTMRERDPDIWVRKCFEKIEEDRRRAVVRPVITDLRQPNEYERCRAEGFVIIRVNCRDEIRLERMKEAGDLFTEADLEHETETHVDTFAVDFEISNNGLILHTYEQIDVIMRELGIDPIIR